MVYLTVTVDRVKLLWVQNTVLCGALLSSTLHLILNCLGIFAILLQSHPSFQGSRFLDPFDDRYYLLFSITSSTMRLVTGREKLSGVFGANDSKGDNIKASDPMYHSIRNILVMGLYVVNSGSYRLSRSTNGCDIYLKESGRP